MKRIVVNITINLILICFLVVIFALAVVYDSGYIDTRTSAVCNGNVCRDYLFNCVDGEVISSKAISGFVTFSEDWIDKREERDGC